MTHEAIPEHSAPSETILFVEDEALIRMDMAEFLRECGYRVHEAADASQAVQALESKFAVDLVFTDIHLPEGMDGLELVEWVFNNRPGVKVIVTTGGASRAKIPRTVEPLLAKPYTGRDLLDRVMRALEKRSEDERSAS
jgi:CheY-like chemotaxis protein